MALNFNGNYKFFHVPKTGGNYVRAVILNTDGVCAEGKHPHAGPLAFGGRNVFDHSFCCVRDPYTWYQSFYRYRVQNGWKTDHPLDINCRGENFEEFIANVLKIWNGNPNGFVTALYLKFIPFVKYVLRMENLTTELQQLWHKWDLHWPENVPIQNTTSKKISTRLPQELAHKLRLADKDIAVHLGYA
jgi:hypothetical protein